jgi:peptidyl-prolyl cis-trans isomerase B (cyclophilin B)
MDMRARFLAGLAGTMAGLVILGCGTPADSVASRQAKLDQARLNQPFSKAVLTADQPPPGADKPIDKTFTGKPTPRLLEEIQRFWGGISLVDAAGKPVEPVVVLETELGEVEITLQPLSAPNHVRNFLALVQVGYFDGMRFDRIRQEEVAGAPELSVSSLEAGCPAGLGNTGGGNLGYWMRSEAGEKGLQQLQMKSGVVGACLGKSPNSACCRFFVLLADAPSLQEDHAAFGRVSKGFSVVQAIAKKSLEPGPDGGELITILKARVQP